MLEIPNRPLTCITKRARRDSNPRPSDEKSAFAECDWTVQEANCASDLGKRILVVCHRCSTFSSFHGLRRPGDGHEGVCRVPISTTRDSQVLDLGEPERPPGRVRQRFDPG